MRFFFILIHFHTFSQFFQYFLRFFNPNLLNKTKMQRLMKSIESKLSNKIHTTTQKHLWHIFSPNKFKDKKTDKKHAIISDVTIVFQSDGHNDETTEKSLLCVEERSMKLNASGRFIGIMGFLFWFHLDFTCGCNLCHTIICQFTKRKQASSSLGYS